MKKNYNLAWCNPSDNKNQKLQNSPVANIDLIKRVIEQISSIKDQVIVIHISDIIIDDEILLTNFAENISLLCASGARIFIVHEYEKIVEKKMQEFSQIYEFEHSHFSQDKKADIIEMIISGRINRNIVTKLCTYSVQAVGLSGKDNFSIIATKSNTQTNSYIGDIQLINPDLLLTHDSNDIVSVLSPIACNEQGRTLILDSCMTAAMIATSIGADHLVMIGEENYFSKNNIIISDLPELQHILEHTSEIALKSKEILAIRHALHNSECSVYFLNAKCQDGLILNLFA